MTTGARRKGRAVNHLSTPGASSDFDFFAPAGGPGAGPAAPSSTPVAPPGFAPSSRFGAPMDASTAPAAMPDSGAPPPPPRRRPRRALVGAVAGVVVVGLLGWFGAPVVLDQFRSDFERTSIGTPKTIGPYVLLLNGTDAMGLVAQADNVVDGQEADQLVVGAYGPAGQTKPTLTVSAAKGTKPFTEEPTAVLEEIFRGMRTAGSTVTPPIAVGPGKLGGAIRCADVTFDRQGMRVCLSIDEAVFTMMLFTDAVEPATVLKVRESITKR